MVLSDRDIKAHLAEGHLVIRPLEEGCIQPASVDLHLGDTMRVFRPWKHPYQIDLQQPLDGLTEVVEIESGHFSLGPGQFVLGVTKEYIALPNDLMGRLEGKSSLGRIGLMVHSTAGFVDPGWHGHLTLELYNVSPLPILLYPGMKISQISFTRLTSPAEHPYGSPEIGSKYQDQVGPTPTRYHQEFQQPALLSTASIPIQQRARQRPQGRSALREWLSNSQFKGSVSALAAFIEVNSKTVEDWVYGRSTPSKRHWPKLYKLTGLPQFELQAHRLIEFDQQGR